MRAIRAVAAFALFAPWIEAARPQAAALTRQDLEGQTTEQLLALAHALRVHTEPILLAPPRELRATYAKYLATPDAGLARLPERDRFVHLVQQRGGGAYYSFATRRNDYDLEPDIGLEQGALRTGFYGSATGALLDIGEGDAAAAPFVETSRADHVDSEAWAVLWKDLTAVKDRTEEIRRLCAPARLQASAPAVAGHTYLLRSVLPGEHDHLVEFTIVDVDERGLILVWRVLKSWPMVRSPHPYRPEAVDWGAPPPEPLARIKAMPLDALVATGDELRKVIDERLLRVPEADAARAAAMPALAGVELARLTSRGWFDHVLLEGWKSGYFSFARRSHSYYDVPDLEYNAANPGLDAAASQETGAAPRSVRQPGYVRGGGHAGAWIADLGDVPLTRLDVRATDPPAPLTRDAWQFFRAEPSAEDRDEMSRQQRLTTRYAAAGKLAIATRADAAVGRTYLLRSVNPDAQDVLVAFTIVAIDRLGMTIAWRTLASWPVAEKK